METKKLSQQLFELALQAQKKGDKAEADLLKKSAFDESANEDYLLS